MQSTCNMCLHSIRQLVPNLCSCPADYDVLQEFPYVSMWPIRPLCSHCPWHSVDPGTKNLRKQWQIDIFICTLYENRTNNIFVDDTNIVDRWSHLYTQLEPKRNKNENFICRICTSLNCLLHIITLHGAENGNEIVSTTNWMCIVMHECDWPYTLNRV